MEYKLVRKQEKLLWKTLYVFSMLVFFLHGTYSFAEEISDRDYQFILKNPGSGWKLLPEEQVNAIVPDAVAGVIKLPNFYSVIIVEQASSFTIEEYMDTIVDGMPIEGKLVKLRKPAVFSNYPAIHSVVSGNVRGVPFRYYLTIVKRGEWFYQLLGWGIEQQSAEIAAEFQAFVDSVEFTSGEIRPRSHAKDERVASGIGWMLDKGTFQSAAYGFEVTAPSEWRLVVGDELTTMSTDAETGMINNSRGAYITITPERLIGMNQSSFSRRFFEQLVLEQADSSEQSQRYLEVLGKSTKFYLFEGSSVAAFDYLAGIVWLDDVAFKIVAWFPSHDQQAALEEIETALAALKPINKADLENLDLKLEAGGSRQNIVGMNYALRNGVYRDFANRFLWRMPSGYWRVETGAEARNRNEDATVFIDSISFGIYGLVICEDIDDIDRKAYHASARDNLWADEGEKIKIKSSEISVGDQLGMMAEGTLVIDEIEYFYSLVTVKYGTRAIQVLFWGLPGNMQRFQDERMLALEGFEFMENRYESASMAKNTWIDERLGFRLQRPGSGWVFKDSTPDAMRSIGTLVGWYKDDASVQVIALCAIGEEQDPNIIIEQMVDNLVNAIDQKGGPKLNKRPTTFKGREAVRIDAQSTVNLEAVLFSRERTAYAVLAIDKKPNKTGLRRMDELVSLVK